MSPTAQAFVNVGDVFESTQKKDRGRKIEVKEVTSYGTIKVRGVASGRWSELSAETLRKNYRRANADADRARRRISSAPAQAAPTPRKIARPVTNERERELLRIVKKKFGDYHKRNSHFYLGAGMSTTHVGWSVIADINALQLFWPPEHIRQRGVFGGRTYVLADDVMKKVQERISRTLNGLAEKGLLEKVGNTDERRWKPTYADEGSR